MSDSSAVEAAIGRSADHCGPLRTAPPAPEWLRRYDEAQTQALSAAVRGRSEQAPATTAAASDPAPAPIGPPPAELLSQVDALRADVVRCRCELFGGCPPREFERLAADLVEIAQGYARNHATERARGYDPTELLAGLPPLLAQIAERLDGRPGTAQLAGARAWCETDDGTRCLPADPAVRRWTSEGGRTVPVSERRPPACDLFLRLSRKDACACGSRRAAVRPQQCKDGRTQYRAECEACNGFAKFVSLAGDSANLEWRAKGDAV